MNILPLNKETMFKYSDIHCRDNATSIKELICYGCKINNNQDLSLEKMSIEDRIAHMEAHEAAGHKYPRSSYIKRWLLDKEIRDHSVQSVEVHYAISNNGDGSASILFFKTAEEASDYDEAMSENGDGWGESCDGSETLYFDKDGILINSHEEEED